MRNQAKLIGRIIFCGLLVFTNKVVAQTSIDSIN